MVPTHATPRGVWPNEDLHSHRPQSVPKRRAATTRRPVTEPPDLRHGSREDLEVPVERCVECGFDSDDWSDEAALEAIGQLPVHWHNAIAGLQADELRRRPIPEMWSIAEYTDHVREVLFAMRFVLESALNQPGVNLGEAPEPEFAPTPRVVDVLLALSGIEREASALRDRLGELTEASWKRTAIIGADEVDAHWICRHAVHDASHHLEDVRRLREALG